MDLRKLPLAALTVALVLGASVTSAGATPPSADPPEATGAVSGALDGSDGRRPLRVAQDGVRLDVRQPTTVTTFDLTYEGGEYSGWHAHPGIVVAVVTSGAVVRQTPGRHGRCVTETFTVGDSFTEVGPHHVANASSTEPAVLSITRIYPSSATEARIDRPAPCR